MKYLTNLRRWSGHSAGLVLLFLASITAPAFGAADVVANFDPNGGTLTCNAVGRSCVTLEVSILFKNEGDQASDARRVSLNRFNGRRASGYAQRFGGSGSFQQLPALAPGETTVLTWSSNRVALGTQTYKPRYSPPLNEGGRVQNGNHNVEVTYDVRAASGSSSSSSSSTNGGSSGSSRSSASSSTSSSSSSSGGDVEANFVANGSVACDTPTTSNFCAQLTIQIRFKNVGQAESQARRISLNQFNGTRASGYATRFGGSGAFEALPALAPGAEATLSWTARRVQLSRYTFKPVYSPALNEGGGPKNTNHNVTETLNVVGQ